MPQASSSMIAQIFQLGSFTSRPRMEHKLSMKLAERTEGVEGRGRASERRKSLATSDDQHADASPYFQSLTISAVEEHIYL